jgi:FkbM family methyltransferase
MKLKHQVNIIIYNVILSVFNSSTWITKRVLGKKFIGRKIVFDFDRTFESNFPKSKEFRFIQIGGNDGISFDGLYQKIISREKKSGIILEPSPTYFKLLEANYKSFPSIKLLPFAIFEHRGKLELCELNEVGLKNHPAWAAGIGSVDINHLLNLNVKPEEISKIEIEGITFKDLLEMHPDFSSIDYLQIDTEGYDYQILKTIDFNSFNVKAIKFEFKNLPLLEQKHAISLLSENFQLYRDDLDMVCLKKGMTMKCRI